MGLPWVRFDTNMPNHDKILGLIHDPSPKKWQAVASYQFSIMWSGGAGTDGRIPAYALASVHGTAATARLLVKHKLWTEHPAAWEIVNYDRRQLLTEAADELAVKRRNGATKGGCAKNHGPECWQNGRCSRGA